MDLNHQNCINMIKEFLKEITDIKLDRAIEVGCGEGLVTRDLLCHRYKLVDMFDQDLKAMRKVKTLKDEISNIDALELSTM